MAKHGIARAWWIARSTDRSGNFIDYDYLNLQDTSIPSQPFTNELLPNHIAYTGHTNAPATRSIHFQYASRSPEMTRTTFAGGMALVDSKLLDAVKMRGSGNETLRCKDVVRLLRRLAVARTGYCCRVVRRDCSVARQRHPGFFGDRREV